MNPFQDKYHQTKGTHCFFCEREYGTDKCILQYPGRPLKRTREHIIPKSVIKISDPRNYIGSCSDCNHLKGPKNAKGFAEKITRLMKDTSHPMHHLLKLMRERAYKLYNKTSRLHKQYRRVKGYQARSKPL